MLRFRRTPAAVLRTAGPLARKEAAGAASTSEEIMVRAGIQRIAILPSELKPGESERPSGLIVQEEHHDNLKRGIITDVGPDVPLFEKGMTVYYHCGLKVEDVEIVHIGHVEGFSDDA